MADLGASGDRRRVVVILAPWAGSAGVASGSITPELFERNYKHEIENYFEWASYGKWALDVTIIRYDGNGSRPTERDEHGDCNGQSLSYGGEGGMSSMADLALDEAGVDRRLLHGLVWLVLSETGCPGSAGSGANGASDGVLMTALLDCDDNGACTQPCGDDAADDSSVCDDVFVHELLHNFGLSWHMNGYACITQEDGNEFCSGGEYGDAWDMLGGGPGSGGSAVEEGGDGLSAHVRHSLGWLRGRGWQQATGYNYIINAPASGPIVTGATQSVTIQTISTTREPTGPVVAWIQGVGVDYEIELRQPLGFDKNMGDVSNYNGIMVRAGDILDMHPDDNTLNGNKVDRHRIVLAPGDDAFEDAVGGIRISNVEITGAGTEGAAATFIVEWVETESATKCVRNPPEIAGGLFGEFYYWQHANDQASPLRDLKGRTNGAAGSGAYAEYSGFVGDDSIASIMTFQAQKIVNRDTPACGPSDVNVRVIGHKDHNTGDQKEGLPEGWIMSEGGCGGGGLLSSGEAKGVCFHFGIKKSVSAAKRGLYTIFIQPVHADIYNKANKKERGGCLDGDNSNGEEAGSIVEHDRGNWNSIPLQVCLGGYNWWMQDIKNDRLPITCDVPELDENGEFNKGKWMPKDPTSEGAGWTYEGKQIEGYPKKPPTQPNGAGVPGMEPFFFEKWEGGGDHMPSCQKDSCPSGAQYQCHPSATHTSSDSWNTDACGDLLGHVRGAYCFCGECNVINPFRDPFDLLLGWGNPESPLLPEPWIFPAPDAEDHGDNVYMNSGMECKTAMDAVGWQTAERWTNWYNTGLHWKVASKGILGKDSISSCNQLYPYIQGHNNYWFGFTDERQDELRAIKNAEEREGMNNFNGGGIKMSHELLHELCACIGSDRALSAELSHRFTLSDPSETTLSSTPPLNLLMGTEQSTLPVSSREGNFTTPFSLLTCAQH